MESITKPDTVDLPTMARKSQPNRGGRDSRIRRSLRAVFARDSDRTTIEECRQCGTTLQTSAPSCPTCGREEIAIYHLE
ncbi:hypothetical protein SAMN04487967_0028 [Natronorubrum sediminis]|uniref:Zinc-ribbon domain-containing protein n=2 Tax=Natronorubrum sediminis TaxID=640943 RepID=A0A1H6FIP9_9EURY|nr:hypothetical protein SAMN04487967_0028 [Natronorubrum sediminis]